MSPVETELYGFIANTFLLMALKLVTPEIAMMLSFATSFLTALNSAVNPFVYAVMLPMFRRGISNLCCSSRRQRENRDAGAPDPKADVAVMSGNPSGRPPPHVTP